MSTHEDALRYVALARSGWADPTVDVLDLIEELAHECSNSDYLIGLADASDAKHAEEIRKLEDAHEVALAALRAQLNPASWTVAELMEALTQAIERERAQAVADEITRVPARIAPCDRPHVDAASKAPRRRRSTKTHTHEGTR